MEQAKPITSASNPRIKSAVKLRRSRERRQSGLFIAEGPREVRRAIKAGLEVVEVYVCPELLDARESASAVAGLAPAVPIFAVPEPLMKLLAYRDKPEGVLAIARQPAWSADGLGARMADDEQGGLLLVAVGTQKPGNLGAMVRTAAAAGCAGVLAAGPGVDVFNPNAVRASTCAVFTLPVVCLNEGEALAWLVERGVRIAATTPGAGAVCHTEADLTGALAVVVGPEDTGLSDAWLSAADSRLAIPTLGETVDSLNASNAAAVVLFEAVRQRGLRGGG